MWLEAILLLLQKAAWWSCQFGDIVAIFGAGQVGFMLKWFIWTFWWKKIATRFYILVASTIKTLSNNCAPPHSQSRRLLYGRLSTTYCQRLENAIVNTCRSYRSQVYRRLRGTLFPISRVRTAKHIVEYSQLIVFNRYVGCQCAPPMIYEATAPTRISLVSSFISARQQWAPDAHLHWHLSLRLELNLHTQL